jgi:hypothetical protein
MFPVLLPFDFQPFDFLIDLTVRRLIVASEIPVVASINPIDNADTIVKDIVLFIKSYYCSADI